MLEKIGVEMQVYYAGDFKGASEPFRLEKLSDENKLQIREYLSDLYNDLVADVAESRNISEEELRNIASNALVRTPEDAVSNGLADKVAYFDEVLTDIKENIGLEEDDKLKVTGLANYSGIAKKKTDYKIKDKIAVVFAEGGIVTGDSEPGEIGDDKYTRIIRKIRKDDKVKAIVLRVNSGGGSALASENIWRELRMAQEKGIPVIASMGDVAASGGYYISAMADTIVAEPETITGSIGVFAMVPNMKEMFNDKFGIHLDTVYTNEMANGMFGTGLEPHNPKQKQILDEFVANIYQIFLNRVAEGRGMTVEEVHKVAQGRVWTGKRAIEHGLVDVMGDLDKAIEIAAEASGLEKYRIREYPVVKEPIEQFLDKLSGQGDSDKVAALLKDSALKDYSEIYELFKELENMEGVQARMPFELEIE